MKLNSLRNRLTRRHIGLGIAAGLLITSPFIGRATIGALLVFAARYPSPELQNSIFYRGSLSYKITSDSHLGEALRWAITRKENFFARIMIEEGAKVKNDPYGHLSPLVVAAMANNVEIANLLLSLGADINEKNSFSVYPLAGAVLENNLEMCELLVKRGAEVNRKSDSMESPLDLAEEYKLPKIAKFLQSAGATKSYNEKQKYINKHLANENTTSENNRSISSENIFTH